MLWNILFSADMNPVTTMASEMPHDPWREQRLKERHSTLDRELGEELRRPAPDPVAVAWLKRETLRTKDELAGTVARPQRPDNALH